MVRPLPQLAGRPLTRLFLHHSAPCSPLFSTTIRVPWRPRSSPLCPFRSTAVAPAAVCDWSGALSGGAWRKSALVEPNRVCERC